MSDLASIGLKKGLHYETVITTEFEGKPNSAPIGVICLDENTVMCRIFNTSQTLKNIKRTGEFTVNITDDPFAFTYSTLSTVPDDYLAEDNSLKCAGSYFKCKVESIKDVVRDVDPVNKSEKSIIKAKAVEIRQNREVKPINRAMDLLVESIYNIKRIDENPDYYLGRLKEAKRVITKVGSREDKKAVRMLLDHVREMGYDL